MLYKSLILAKTSDGFDVFDHFIGPDCRKRLFRNPYRRDTNASCRLYRRSGKGYYMKDFGDSDWCCDCFGLVARIKSLDERKDFMQILHIIDDELKLFVFIDSSLRFKPTPNRVKEVELPRENHIVKFIPKYRNFNKYEIAFWEQYGITLEILDRYEVRCLSSCYFEHEDGKHYTIYSSVSSPMFGYTFRNGEGIKIYRPSEKIGRFLYAGYIPKPYVFGLDMVMNSESSMLVITGGEKDVLTLASHGFSAITFNSETAVIPYDIMETLWGRYDDIVILYDSDEVGIKSGKNRMKELQDRFTDSGGHRHRIWNVILPLSGTKEEKDVSDYFRIGHQASELGELLYCNLKD